MFLSWWTYDYPSARATEVTLGTWSDKLGGWQLSSSPQFVCMLLRVNLDQHQSPYALHNLFPFVFECIRIHCAKSDCTYFETFLIIPYSWHTIIREQQNILLHSFNDGKSTDYSTRQYRFKYGCHKPGKGSQTNWHTLISQQIIIAITVSIKFWIHVAVTIV